MSVCPTTVSPAPSISQPSCAVPLASARKLSLLADEGVEVLGVPEWLGRNALRVPLVQTGEHLPGAHLVEALRAVGHHGLDGGLPAHRCGHLLDQQLSSSLAGSDDAAAAWRELAHALVNKKEFVFLR